MNLGQVITAKGRFRLDAQIAPILIPVGLFKKKKYVIREYFKPLNEPTLKVLEFLRTKKGVGSAEVRQACSLNKDQVANILMRLEVRGLISVEGDRGHFVYVAVE